MRRLRGCWLGVIVWTACTPVNSGPADATKRESSAKDPPVVAKTVETKAAPTPPIAVTPAPKPEEPPLVEWRRQLAAAYALRVQGQSDVREIEALERRAWTTIQGLPDDAPDVLEALCLAGSLSLVGADDRTAMWERAVAIEAKRPLTTDVRAQYASLGRATPRYQIEYAYGLITFSGSPIGSKPQLQAGSLLLPTTYDEDCARADRVFLRMQVVDAWSSAGMGHAMVAPNMDGGAVSDRKYATAAALFVDLYDRAVRDLGKEDPLLATFIDYGLAYCDRVTRRSHGKSVCLPDRRALERALALREKGFGDAHPLTNSSRISLGGVLLADGEAQRGEELIKAAAGARPGSMPTISALRTLAGIQLLRGENAAAEASAAVASQMARELLDPKKDSWEYDTTLAYHARIAGAAGLLDKSEEAYKVAQKGNPAEFAYELAEVQRAAGKDAEAIATYDLDMQSIEKSSQRGVDWYAASRMVRSMKGKIAALEHAGRTAEVAPAQARLKELEALAKTG